MSALIFLTTFFSGCKTESADSNEERLELDNDYYEFKGISLADHGINAMVMLPDETANIGASTKPEVIHTEGDFKWDIHVGPNFHLHIEDYGDYTDRVETKKKELKEYGHFKIRYLIDEKDLILYEQTLIVRGSKNASPTVGYEHKSYHVFGQKVIDGITYELRSRDEGYEKVIIQLMAKTIKSFKPIKEK
ncbi:MAG: hypothetical protein ACK45H_08620 [Bacteroidota bacterium]